MKNLIKVLTVLALSAAMLFTFSLFVSAEEYVKWEMSEDGTVLTGDGREYIRYDAPIKFFERPDTVYEYSQYLRTDSGISSYVSAPYAGADYVWISDKYYEPVIYCATDEAREMFDAFFDGKGEPHITEGYYHDNASPVDEALLTAIRSAQSGIVRTEEVADLEEAEYYELAMRDESHTFLYTVGIMFYLDGSYWYTDYSALGNQHFDADGNFSFRSGSVTLYAADSAATPEIMKAVNGLEYLDTDYTWEDYDPYYEQDTSDLSMAVFWVAYSVLGFAVPLLTGGAAAAVANVRKLGKPKYYYSVSIACGVWIIAAAVLAVILII